MSRLILWALFGLCVLAYSTKAAITNKGGAPGAVDHQKVHTSFDVPDEKAPKAQAVKAGSMKQQLGNQVKSKAELNEH